MKIRIALLVPEYRTEISPGGGVDTVVDFIYSAFTANPSWTVEIISPRMWRKAPEHQRLLQPQGWSKKPTVSTRLIGEKKVTYVGAHLAEFEIMRNRPRGILNQVLEPFDLVVAVSGTPAFFNSLEGLNKPIIAQVATTMWVERSRLVKQGSLLRRLYNRLSRFVMYRKDKRGVQIPDVTLVENPWMEAWCWENGASEVKLEIPGVDTDFFSPPMTEFEPHQRSKYIVSIGRLGEVRKDFGLLVRAYGKAVEEYNVTQKLVIAGRGDLSPEVYSEIQRLNLNSRIEIRRNLSPEALRDCYRNADLFAMSSSEEGLGLVLLESMACGTPIISTATEGAKSVVNIAEAGTLVELNLTIEESLAQAIANLANDKALLEKESEKARLAALNNFNLASQELKFREIAQSLLP